MKTGHGIMFPVRVILAIKSEKVNPDPVSIGCDEDPMKIQILSVSQPTIEVRSVSRFS